MKRMTPKQISETLNGEFTFPQMSNYELECCDCGCAHMVDFVVAEKRENADGSFEVIDLLPPQFVVGMRARRNSRATDRNRTKMEKKADKGPKSAKGVRCGK